MEWGNYLQKNVQKWEHLVNVVRETIQSQLEEKQAVLEEEAVNATISIRVD